MRALIRVAMLVVDAAATVMVPVGGAHADVVMNISLSWPSGAGVGATNIPASFTVQNSNTAPQQNDTLRLTLLRLARSCGAVRSGTNVCPSPDPGVYQLSSAATGAAGTACAGITFVVSAPDVSGTVSLTPSSAVVLQGPGGPVGSDRCTVNMLVNVTKVATIDVDPGAPGVQTWTNLFVQATSSPSNLIPATGVSLEDTVNPGIPGLSTSALVVPAGNRVVDFATVTATGSGPLPTGTVTFRVYGPNDSSCTGTPQTSNSVNTTSDIDRNRDGLADRLEATRDQHALGRPAAREVGRPIESSGGRRHPARQAAGRTDRGDCALGQGHGAGEGSAWVATFQRFCCRPRVGHSGGSAPASCLPHGCATDL